MAECIDSGEEYQVESERCHARRQAQIDKARLAFRERFGCQPDWVVRAPGRVNLIGEHTDYNEGFVFPAAIDREIIIAASKSKSANSIADSSASSSANSSASSSANSSANSIADSNASTSADSNASTSADSSVFALSLDYAEEDQFDLHDIAKRNSCQWANYLRGVLSTLQRTGHRLAGFNAVICGDVPQGAGLSSSAAYEVAVATLCNKINDLEIGAKDIALIAQRAENEFVGVQCGIMDQFISALGEEDSALLIDCRSLESRAIPLNLSQHAVSIVITNTGVRRGLVDSQYNARRAECAAGVKRLAELSGRHLNSLRDIEFAEFEKFSIQLDPVVAGRCRHVVSENKRVLDAVTMLEQGDLYGFGQMMNDSHRSLRDHFEVSCLELDILVELSQNHPGVIGARMTGGGFGGCTVAIMQNKSLQSYLSEVIPAYQNRTGRIASVYICRATAGASVIK
jgi:galactokinase